MTQPAAVPVSLFIASGTIVGAAINGGAMMVPVTLQGDVWIDGAVREEDGSYRYEVGGRSYYASASTVRVLPQRGPGLPPVAPSYPGE